MDKILVELIDKGRHRKLSVCLTEIGTYWITIHNWDSGEVEQIILKGDQLKRLAYMILNIEGKK